MAASEIFNRISSHQVEGMMLHNDMADFYAFLGLAGFSKMHEYHFLNESADMREVHEYYISRYNMLLKPVAVNAENNISMLWYEQERADVDMEAKQNAVKAAMAKWVSWERATKEMYQKAYTDLCSENEIVAAYKVHELMCEVDRELKEVEKLHLLLHSTDYSMEYICSMQDKYREMYADKEREIGENANAKH